MSEKDRHDELDEHVHRVWEHLQTTASDKERAAWEQALQALQETELPWWRRLPGLRPRPGQLPPRKAGYESPAQAALTDHERTAGFPVEGFFAARADQITEAVVEHGPGPEFSAVEAKMMSPVEVASLGEIVGAGSYEQLIALISTSEREGRNGTTGLYFVPGDIGDGLVQADLETVSGRWAATEEMQAWPLDDVRATLTALRDLASAARSQDKELWVWWSA